MDGGSGWTPGPSNNPPASSSQHPNDTATFRTRPILLIEDNPGDVALVREALAEHRLTGDLTVVRDGERAVELIARLDSDPRARRPGVIILDLNLPKVNGHEILQLLQNSTYCQSIPVMVLSSSAAEADRHLAKKFGAREYVRKPSNLDDFLAVGKVIERLLKGANGVC